MYVSKQARRHALTETAIETLAQMSDSLEDESIPELAVRDSSFATQAPR